MLLFKLTNKKLEDYRLMHSVCICTHNKRNNAVDVAKNIGIYVDTNKILHFSQLTVAAAQGRCH